MIKQESEYINNKKDILNRFSINKKSNEIIVNFMKYLMKETELSFEIIDHFFNSFIIIINYDTKNINIIKNLLDALKQSDKLLIMELSEQLNKFKDYEYEDQYDTIIFDTFYFFSIFNKNNNLKASINIIHEVIFNILRMDDKLDKDIRIKIYIELLNDIIKKQEDNKSNKSIYLSTVEICNMTVRLLNEWIN